MNQKRQPKKGKREAYAIKRYDGLLHTFWEDTGRIAIYASRRATERALEEKLPGRGRVVKVEITEK